MYRYRPVILFLNPLQMGSANINDRSQKGDGDSEIALVVEDNEMFQTTMNGRPYNASKFAATLRRRLYRGTTERTPSGNPLTLNLEHLGLLEPQQCDHKIRGATSFMKPAPHPIEDESRLEEDRVVADPLADETILLWESTAKKNREVFTELFRPVPTNLVRSKSAYKVSYDPRPRVPTFVSESGPRIRRTFPMSGPDTSCLTCPCNASRIDCRRCGVTSSRLHL